MAVDDFDVHALMPLETPVLKVSRAVAACSRCRNAKIKCDGKLPACSSCEKSGRDAECTSTNDQFARGKERSYVSTLETKIDKLQAKLADVRLRNPSVISLSDEDISAAVSPRRPSYQLLEPTPPSGSRSERRKEASTMDDLVSGFGLLSVNATARDFYGFTSAMSYARLILSACSKDPLPHGTTKALPPRHVATQLVQHYLNNIFVLLPIFEEASFYASVDAVYSNNPHKGTHFDHWSVRMVLAIANVSLSEQRGDQHYLEAVGHVIAALDQQEQVLHPGAISGVQALLLLVEYAMLDPHHFDSWSLIGAASRAMVDLGLHQDPPKGTQMSKGKLDLRRRVYYCVYCLDRSTSLVQTRAFSFSDDSASVKVPYGKSQSIPMSSSHDPSKTHHLWLQSHQQAVALIDLCRIQSECYTELFQSGREPWPEPYPYLWAICAKLTNWFNHISASTSPTLRTFFEVDLLYSYIYILSPSPRVPNVAPFAQNLIFEYCLRYADTMIRLISDPTHTAPLSFYNAMRVYMTGRQFLDILHDATNRLISGHLPEPPTVKADSMPPPQMPMIAIPPGSHPRHVNTQRSITCITQLTECLSRFGSRWGYMSWHTRFVQDASPMLDELKQRLWDLDDATGARRRPSTWQHGNSTGSITSEAAVQYQSSPHNSGAGGAMCQPPQQPMGPPQQVPLQQPDKAERHTSYESTGPQGNQGTSSPPISHPQIQQGQQMQFQQAQEYQMPTYQHPQLQQQQQSFNSTQPVYTRQPQPQAQIMPQPQYRTAPSHQFAQWQGYQQPQHSHPPTEDDEHARLLYGTLHRRHNPATVQQAIDQGNEPPQQTTVVHQPQTQIVQHPMGFPGTVAVQRPMMPVTGGFVWRGHEMWTCILCNQLVRSRKHMENHVQTGGHCLDWEP